MLFDFDVELVTPEEVATLFKTTPAKIKQAIRNGTLPIGFVSDGLDGQRERTIIIRKRLENFVLARDLDLTISVGGGEPMS